ncbi:hypothetical protein BDA96_03G122200 [Sorghum bicolor]|uniref:Rapid alkalinization factor 1 n=2 Tax=Sorghum bicolor TaxID=4558 RepID=A0A921RCH3_SORBI|nr:rapid alkalinization factor [Sorghum bicolor]EES02710.1 hypothetical protein SORBI_3003G117500 [Sorghum bicolor]KAG0537138.1 hypothetical protein BDA96_03G122200 [Sorghum bicolor]|eukprot:XP_002457590.1 rapid alkalinization factor [Sorghum bicolor]
MAPRLQLRAAAVLALLMAVVSVAALSAAPASAAGVAVGDLAVAHLAGAVVIRRGGRTCRGTVGECMEYLGADAEGEADVAGMATGGSKRRVLQGGSGYIGYDALRRDNVPCSQRGASYYNCQPGAEANPYSRGCSAITQCRG